MQNETSPGGLRGRRRAATELDLEEAALTAFADGDFDGVTMEAIAAAAGVSVRTAFRYFPTKVDTVLHTARQISVTIGEAIGEVGADATVRTVEASIDSALAQLVESDAGAVDRLRRLRTLMLGDPRLRAEVAKAEGYLSGLDAALAAGTRPGMERRLLLEIAAATLRTAFDSWADDETDDSGRGLLAQYRRAREIRAALVD